MTNSAARPGTASGKSVMGISKMSQSKMGQSKTGYKQSPASKPSNF
jgi:hypothetical protein